MQRSRLRAFYKTFRRYGLSAERALLGAKMTRGRIQDKPTHDWMASQLRGLPRHQVVNLLASYRQ